MSRTQPTFFDSAAAADAFNDAFTTALRRAHKKFVANFILPENIQRFYHGSGWRYPGNASAGEGHMQEIASELTTKLDDVILQDLSLLNQAFRKVNDDMQRQFAHIMYSTMSTACDTTGNVVDAQKEGSLANGFITMLEKIELAADKNGEVKMPEIHAAPEIAERMMKELQASSPEFQERVKMIKEKKIAEALDREAARKAKFVRFGE